MTVVSSVNSLMCFSSGLIQMGAAWGEKISSYWPRLNAVLMKARTDNSFFIMSIARLGISFYIAETAKFFFDSDLSSFDGVRLCVWNVIFVCVCVCFSSIKLLEAMGGWWILFTPKNRQPLLRKIILMLPFKMQFYPCVTDITVISHDLMEPFPSSGGY